jgi:hypothetical protein
MGFMKYICRGERSEQEKASKQLPLPPIDFPGGGNPQYAVSLTHLNPLASYFIMSYNALPFV